MSDCPHCSRSFENLKALNRHLRTSSHHSWCDRCSKAFNSDQAKQQHLRDSPRHHVCIWCPALDFETDRELNIHLSLHRDNTEEISDNSYVDGTSFEYLGIAHSVIEPVFALALRLRFQQPTVDFIVSMTKTTLNRDIISALVAAALCLLPVDNTPQGVTARKERDRIRASEAKHAEQDFFGEFSRLGYNCVNEDQQRGLSTLTPDVRFKEPVLIRGHLCWWLEYKDYFGFRNNPFISQKNKKQVRKYAEQIGSGAIVYKLGFESGHINIEGVKSFREQEVRQHLIQAAHLG